MKKKFCIITLFVTLLLISCSQAKEAEKVHSETELQEIGSELNKLENAVKKIVSNVNNQRQLYRRLGDKYLELGWVKEAYEAYSNALDINPSDETIHYKAAVVAASYAKQIFPATDLVLNYEAAEFHYAQALKIRPDYQEAVLGIGVLYHFELNRSAEAYEYVNGALEKKNIITPQLLMLRANIALHFDAIGYVGNVNENWMQLALSDYDKVIELYGKLNDVEIEEVVGAAIRMREGLK